MKHKVLYLGDGPSPCQTCGDKDAPFRCLDCFSDSPSCQRCIVVQHAHSIMHRLQVMLSCLSFPAPDSSVYQKWNGSFFNDISLFELGVSHQLGHDINERCELPSSSVDLTLFDISGVRIVWVQYCLCGGTGDKPALRHCQLLRACWFPATFSRPSTAFTFRLLDFFHKLQTQSKVNLYDFYNSLSFVNNSASQKPPVVCPFLLYIHTTDVCFTQYQYNELSLVLRIWVHLRQLRRGGGTHFSGGFKSLGPGLLSIDCPACPHPGKNLVTPQVDR